MQLNWTTEVITDFTFFGTENISIDPFSIFDDFNLSEYNDLNISKFDNSNDAGLKEDLWRDIPLGFILTLLSLLTFVGNAMVLHAVRTERRLQTVSYKYIITFIHLICHKMFFPSNQVYFKKVIF